MMTSAAISPNSAADNLSLSLADIHLIVLIVGLLEFLLIHLLTIDRKRIYTLIHSHFQSINQSKHRDGNDNDNDGDVMQNKRGEASLSRADIDVVLTSLGMFCNGDEQKLPLSNSFDADYLSQLFEVENPSMEEVKEAFDVFDENKDGFIDAEELQKILCSLGFKQGFKLDNCREMIAELDQNGDARIDFHEFVKFMESGE